MPLLGNLFALVVAVVLGAVVNMVLVGLGPAVFPPPAGVDVTNPEKLADSVHLFQPRHFVFPWLAHALGSLVGAFVVHVLAPSRRWPLAWGVGGFFFAGGLMAASMIPAPAWFIALDLLGAYMPMAWLGGRLAERVRPSAVATEA